MNRHSTSIVQKLNLMALGLAVALLLTELSLRLAGGAVLWIEEVRNKAGLAKQKTFTILCLGESTTMLGGNDSYPRQLERLLNEKISHRNIRVVNKGLAGVTSTGILFHLENFLEEYKPDLAVVMMGINDTPATLVFEKSLKQRWLLFVSGLRVIKLYDWLRLGLARIWGGWEMPQDLSEQELMKEILRNLRNQSAIETLGNVYEQTGRRALAQRLYRKSIRSFPKKSFGYELLAKFYNHQGEQDMALAVYADAIKKNPAKAWGYILMAQAYRSFHHYESAQKILDEGINRVNARTDLEFEKAVTFTDEGRFAEARNLLDPIIQSGQAGASILAQAGKVYWLSDRKTEALQFFKKSMTADPVKGQFAIDWLIDQGHGRIAEDILTGMLSQADTARPALLRSIVLVYERTGNKAMAKTYIQELESLNSDFYLAATKENYRKLAEILHAAKIPLVSVQYSIRPLGPLQNLLKDFSETIFVDNESEFKEALKSQGFQAIFTDSFAGDFGHCTPAGNQILARNVSDKIISIINNNPPAN